MKQEEQKQKEQELERLNDAQRLKVQDSNVNLKIKERKKQSWKRNGQKLSGKNQMRNNGKIMMV
jgi:hypothetical protein